MHWQIYRVSHKEVYVFLNINISKTLWPINLIFSHNKDETLVSLHTNFYVNRSEHFREIDFFSKHTSKIKTRTCINCLCICSWSFLLIKKNLLFINKFVFNLQRLRNLACEILLRPFLTFFYEIHPNFHLHVQHQPDLQHLEGALQQQLPLFTALFNFYEITSQTCYRLVE